MVQTDFQSSRRDIYNDVINCSGVRDTLILFEIDIPERKTELHF